MSVQLCHPYVWEDPRYIFKAWSSDGKCVSELVNRIVIVYMISIILGFLLSAAHINGGFIIFGVLGTVVLIPTFIQLRKTRNIPIMHDISGESLEGFAEEIKPAILPGNPDTLPSSRNPFNNILVDDYKYAPAKEKAPNITSTESKIALDAMFRTQWYSDPTDVFGKTQSQRIFLTQPITTIPNDQTSYQNWLYKIPGKTCKEGNSEACYGGTDGAAIPWLNI